jgi:hypothetical protein
LCFSGTELVWVEAAFAHGYESVSWSSCATEARDQAQATFFSQYVRFTLSVLFHQCPVLLFVYHRCYIISASDSVIQYNNALPCTPQNNNNNNNNNNLANLELVYLTRSRLTLLEVSLMVSPGFFFCLLVCIFYYSL